jgi:hypothetical protein
MLKKTFITVSLLAAFAAAQAQNVTTSPAKKELIARILKAQQGSVEAMGRSLVERPAIEIMNGAMQVVMARVPKEKQEQMARDIQGDAQKFVNEAGGIVTKRAVELAPSTIGAVLDEKFTEDELKQIVAALENPALTKFTQTAPQMQQALGEKLVAETRPQVEPKVKALEEQVGKRLGLPAQGAAPAASGKKK